MQQTQRLSGAGFLGRNSLGPASVQRLPRPIYADLNLFSVAFIAWTRTCTAACARDAYHSHDALRSGSPMRTDGHDTYCFGPSSTSETQTHQMPARRGTASGKRGRRAGGSTARAERGRAADAVEPLRRVEEGLRVRRAERHEQSGLQVWGRDAQRRARRGQRDQRRHRKRHVRPGVPHSHDMEQTSTAHAGTSSAT